QLAGHRTLRLVSERTIRPDLDSSPMSTGFSDRCVESQKWAQPLTMTARSAPLFVRSSALRWARVGLKWARFGHDHLITLPTLRSLGVGEPEAPGRDCGGASQALIARYAPASRSTTGASASRYGSWMV